MLSTLEITVSYSSSDQKRELDGVSVSLVPGQITAVVGPNGSGKSTLVRALSRVLPPRAGSVLLDGRDLYREISARGSAKSISVAPQDTHIAFEFTARDIVAMGLSPGKDGWSVFAGENAAESLSIEEALRHADITPEQAKRPIMTLSGGERQRVLIARALVQEVPVVLLDEPTASLDIGHQVRLFAQLRELASTRETAIVVVLHDLNQAASLADRLIVLSDGRIAAQGAVADVLTEELIRSVYRCDVRLHKSWATGTLTICAVLEPSVPLSLAGKKIHVICGGGTAAILGQLKKRGASLTVGPLHAGDVDHLAADELGIGHTVLSPFEIDSEPVIEDLCSIHNSSDAIVFAPASVGPANVNSIRSAIMFARMGADMYILRTPHAEGWECNSNGSGAVSALWEELIGLLQRQPFHDLQHLVDFISGELIA